MVTGVKGRVIVRVCISFSVMVVATVNYNPNYNLNSNLANWISEIIPS